MARIGKTGKHDYDVFIIGGGTAGVRIAQTLAAEGKRVGIAEPGALGGYEANDGYGARAPLVQAARLFNDIRHAAEIGIRGGSVGYNYPTLREWSLGVVGSAQTLGARLQALGVDTYPVSARFIGPHEVSLGRRHVTSAAFVIATGSRPIVPETIRGLEGSGYLTPRTAGDLLKPPKSLFIIGGGKTGVEFSSLFTSFGTTVYVAEIAPRLLPDEDSEASALVEAQLKDRGSEVLSSTRITAIARDGLLQRVTYLRGDVEHVVKVERVLLAGGRTPNLDVGLENAEVDYTPLGVTVSSGLQTSNRSIYAAGSVTGAVSGSEGARIDADVVAQNLLRRDKAVTHYTSVPVVVYGQPEIARVGVNEAEALRKDIVTTNAVVSLSETVIGRATRSEGFVKLVADRKGIVIGATAAGHGAAETINGLALAVETGMSAATLARIPYAYGSAGEATGLAARKLLA